MVTSFFSCAGSVMLLWAAVFRRTDFASAEVRIPCTAMPDNWFPGVAPQSSIAPYTLNLTMEDGKPVSGLYHGGLVYGPGQETYIVSLNGTQSGNETETFIAFLIYAENEFDDEANGQFLSPFPAGVSVEECHLKDTAQLIQVVHNSTAGQQWQSIQVKWKSPSYYPAGKITIRAAVAKEDGIYWEGINITLGYVCAVPGCYLPKGCPNGLAKTKFGCQTCTCAGAGNLGAGFAGLLTLLVILNSWI